MPVGRDIDAVRRLGILARGPASAEAHRGDAEARSVSRLDPVAAEGQGAREAHRRAGGEIGLGAVHSLIAPDRFVTRHGSARDEAPVRPFPHQADAQPRRRRGTPGRECHDLEGCFGIVVDRFAGEAGAQRHQPAGRAHGDGELGARLGPTRLAHEDRDIGLQHAGGIRGGAQQQRHRGAAIRIRRRHLDGLQARREGLVRQADPPAGPVGEGRRVHREHELRIAREAGARRAIEEARRHRHRHHLPRHQLACGRGRLHGQAFGHEGIDAEAGSPDRRRFRVGQRLHRPRTRRGAAAQRHRPEQRRTRRAFRRQLREDLPAGAADAQPHRQVHRGAGRVAQQRRDLHRLAGAVDAAVQPEEGIEGGRMRAARGTPVRQVEGRGLKVECGEIRPIRRMDRDGREPGPAAQQRRGEAGEARIIRRRFAQHLIVARDQRHANTGLHSGRAKRTRLHRHAIGAAPRDQADIGDDDRQRRRRLARCIAIARAQGEDEKPRRRGAQDVGQRQRGALGAVHLKARDLGAAFPQQSAGLLGEQLGRVGLHRLPRLPGLPQAHEVALRHPDQPDRHGGDIGAAERNPRLLSARQDMRALVEGEARRAVRHRHRQHLGAGERRVVLAGHAGAEGQARGAAPGQAGHAELIALAHYGEVGDGGLGANPVAGRPILAPRGRQGEGDAGTRGFGFRLRPQSGGEQPDLASRGREPRLQGGVRGRTLGRCGDGFQHLRLAVQHAQGIGHHQQGGDFRRPGRDDGEGDPGRHQRARRIGRAAGQVQPPQRHPGFGRHRARGEALLPPQDGGGDVVLPLGLDGARLGGGAGLRVGAGEAALQFGPIGAGVALQPRQFERARRHGDDEGDQQQKRAHGTIQLKSERLWHAPSPQRK